jgi:hypothetical protein
MKLKVKKEDVWVASMKDRPGGLSGKLDALAGAGANLEFLIARRAPDRPGTGVVFLTPVKGGKQAKAARKAGFKRTVHLHSIRIEGSDKRGLCAKLTRKLAKAGINLRGFSAAAVGKRFVAHLGLDTSAAANEAVKLLKRL